MYDWILLVYILCILSHDNFCIKVHLPSFSFITFYTVLPVLSFFYKQIKNLQLPYLACAIIYEYQFSHLPWNKGLWCKQFFVVLLIARDEGRDGRGDNKNPHQPCIFDVAAVLCCGFMLPEETRCIKQCLKQVLFKHWEWLFQQVLAFSNNICSGSCIAALWDHEYFGIQHENCDLYVKSKKKRIFPHSKLCWDFRSLKDKWSSLFHPLGFSDLFSKKFNGLFYIFRMKGDQ